MPLYLEHHRNCKKDENDTSGDPEKFGCSDSCERIQHSNFLPVLGFVLEENDRTGGNVRSSSFFRSPRSMPVCECGCGVNIKVEKDDLFVIYR